MKGESLVGQIEDFGRNESVINSSHTERASSSKSKAKPSKLALEILYLVLKISIVVLIILLAFTLIFGIEKNEGNAMSPAFKNGDLVLYYRLDSNYSSGDIIVVEYEEEIQMRRVVAVAGDIVDITEDGLIINGSLQQERNINTDTLVYEGGIELPVTLQEGELFVLGDNRLESLDSRMYGPIHSDIAAGKVALLIRTKNF